MLDTTEVVALIVFAMVWTAFGLIGLIHSAHVLGEKSRHLHVCFDGQHVHPKRQSRRFIPRITWSQPQSEVTTATVQTVSA